MTERRCAQCWKTHPYPAAFIGKRGRPVAWCDACRARYRGWDKLTPAERAARVRTRAVRPTPAGGARVHFVARSGNRKLGPIPVTMTDESSCPTTCPWFGKGCYAEHGKNGAHWRKVPERGGTWDDLCRHIAALPPGTLWRHNEAGDLPHAGGYMDLTALDALVGANVGRRGFTFTHHRIRHDAERVSVAAANLRGFTINLSADNLADADRLAAMGIAPVAVVLPTDAPAHPRTPAGRHVVVCPAETAGMTCERCRLCANPARKAIVGFRAHGQAKALVTDLVRRTTAPP